MQIILPLLIISSSLLCHKSVNCANPASTSTHPTDTLNKHSIFTILKLYRCYFLATGLFHAPTHLALTPEFTALLTTIIVAGLTRLLAFRQLGRSFTFRLTTPSHLVTTGLCRYVRHPSYTAVFVQTLTAIYTWCRTDGVPIIIAFRISDEEGLLQGAFRSQWEDYCARTRMLVPLLL
ncbi:hypothetical protein BO71DRAFT_453595 [Aspergillus ellipticus CBS 707.79]|uniref:Protein-S-isoprenylcysteine O-methyltransferase n=1 Tax=Aspergillus ellipticus CBS 707.79 TaxID=1448320 RepID=A0A319D3Y2_9EURO|nr:hypothetical protein BO71DRAFT_453595 [Aspergillus ellipticus CBS 707.79]